MTHCKTEIINNEKVVIPNCMSVVNSLDILDCTCDEIEKSIVKSIEHLNNRIKALGEGYPETRIIKKELKLLKKRLGIKNDTKTESK